ncbi:hypothetical protein D3C81_2140430 [compost metagenome]
MKMDSVSERRLKEWTSWEKLSTPKARVWAWRRASSEYPSGISGKKPVWSVYIFMPIINAARVATPIMPPYSRI